MSQIVGDVWAMKEQFLAAMSRAREQTLADLKWETLDPDERWAVTFEAFRAAGPTLWAEALADHIGLGDACRAHGLDGLLDVLAVRLAVGARMSFVHYQVVGNGIQSRQPALGEGYDLWHGVLTSVGAGGWAASKEAVCS